MNVTRVAGRQIAGPMKAVFAALVAVLTVAASAVPLSASSFVDDSFSLLPGQAITVDSSGYAHDRIVLTMQTDGILSSTKSTQILRAGTWGNPGAVLIVQGAEGAYEPTDPTTVSETPIRRSRSTPSAMSGGIRSDSTTGEMLKVAAWTARNRSSQQLRSHKDQWEILT